MYVERLIRHSAVIVEFQIMADSVRECDSSWGAGLLDSEESSEDD